jgi:hypothetical protein
LQFKNQFRLGGMARFGDDNAEGFQILFFEPVLLCDENINRMGEDECAIADLNGLGPILPARRSAEV